MGRRPVILDTEWTSLRIYHDARPTSLNYRIDGRSTLVQEPACFDEILAVISDPRNLLVMHFAPFDLCALSRLGPQWRTAIESLPPDRIACTNAMAHLIRPDLPGDLMSLAKYVLDMDIAAKIQPVDYSAGPPPDDYMTFDLEATDRLYHELSAIIRSESILLDVYRKSVEPIIPVVVRMRNRGLPFNQKAASKLSAQIQTDLAAADSHLHKLGLPKSVKPTQLGQVAQWITRRFKADLPKTDTGAPSLDAKKLAEHVPATRGEARAILAIQNFQRIEAARKGMARYFKDVAPDGLVHPGWNPTGAVTGRFACEHPNCQNIPKRKEKYGKEFRELFYPPQPDQYLLGADYDSIEMRFLAHYSEDDELIYLVSHKDAHNAAGTFVFLNVPAEDDPWWKDDSSSGGKEWRQVAKHFNFAKLYGSGVANLAKTVTKMSQEAGIPLTRIRPIAETIRLWNGRFPAAANLCARTVAMVRQFGCVQNAYGRVIPVPEKTPYVGTNNLIQSTPGDMIRRAMVRLEEHNIPVRAQIHDELWVGPVSKRDLKRIERQVVSAMTADAWMFRVPINVETKVLHAAPTNSSSKGVTP